MLATISDRKFGVSSGSSSLIDHYEPFGMLSRVELPTSGVAYKFGFNGKLNDNEVKGLGNQQDYGMRIYDPRVGRFLSVDPLTKDYAELTPYQFSSNAPIANIDLDGLEAWDPKQKVEKEAKGVPWLIPITEKAVESKAVEVVIPATKKGAREVVKRFVTSSSTKAGGLTLILTLLPLRGGPKFPHHDEMYYLMSEKEFRMLYPNDPLRPFDKGEPIEQVTTDPSTLSDEYLAEVAKRIKEGTATEQDWQYQDEIIRRKKESKKGKDLNQKTTFSKLGMDDIRALQKKYGKGDPKFIEKLKTGSGDRAGAYDLYSEDGSGDIYVKPKGEPNKEGEKTDYNIKELKNKN